MVSTTVKATIWHFKTDQPARRRFFHPQAFSHPAKMHLGLLQRLIDLYTAPGDTLLDPMAGTGSLMLAATQMRDVILRDIQPEYIDLIHLSAPIIRNQAGLFAGLIDVGCADARTLECPPFDHIITSPPYGFETGAGVSNPRRVALLYMGALGQRWKRYLDNPTHASVAAGFRYLGGQANIGNMSGRNYWREMQLVYERCVMFLPPEGKLIVVLKNHYRRGQLIDITGRTIELVQALGLELVARYGRWIDNPSLWQRRRREQGLPIVDVEDVLVFSRR
jgi:DNA modification methylase